MNRQLSFNAYPDAPHPIVSGSANASMFRPLLQPYYWDNTMTSTTTCSFNPSGLIELEPNFVFSGEGVRILSEDEGLVTIVPVREPSFREAKEEIADYIRELNGEPVYISHIAEATHIDIDIIFQVIEELEREGLVLGETV